MANRVNVVFDTLLPLTDDHRKGLRALGLSSKCGKFIGNHWFSDEVNIQWDIRATCPEVANVGPSRYVLVMLAQPETIPRLFLTAIDHTRPYLDPQVGHIEGGDFARIDSLSGPQYRSLGDIIDRLSALQYRSVLLFAAALAACTFWICLRKRDYAIMFLLAECFLVIIYCVLSSLFGDGVINLARHSFLNQSLLPGTIVVCSVVLSTHLRRKHQ